MRRILLVVIAISGMMTVLVGGHYYIAQRLLFDPQVAEPWRSAGVALLALLFASLILQPIGERLLPPERARLIAWPASLWMGLAFLLITGLGAADALHFVAGDAARAAEDGAGAAGAAGMRGAVVVGIALLAAGFGMRGVLRPPPVRRVEVELGRWPRSLDGFRIVQISDIHIGPILGRRFASDLVDRVNALEPDLVAVTGDLVDGAVRHLADEVAPFGGLRARHGTFFVTGNHDHYSGAGDWCDVARELGMRVLRNERVRIDTDGASFDVVGVDDHRGDVVRGGAREDLEAALAGRDEERPALLLAHDPTTFRKAARRGIDLQLSGHTHGGQIWPFVYLVRLAVPFVAGHYRRGTSQLYVSRGTGFWGPPMRLGAPAEITELVLRSGDQHAPGSAPEAAGAPLASGPH